MKLGEMEDYLFDLEQLPDDFIFREDDEERIIVEESYVVIPKYKIKIATGYSQTMDEDSEEYETDCDWLVYFDMDTNEYLYMENGSSLVVSVYNYLTAIGYKDISIDELEELECYHEINALD